MANIQIIQGGFEQKLKLQSLAILSSQSNRLADATFSKSGEA